MVLQFKWKKDFPLHGTSLSKTLLMFSTGVTSLSALLLFPLLIAFFVFMYVFDSISSNIDDILSINPSANMFVFWDFSVHHKGWLIFSGRIDKPGELCYNFLSQTTLLRWLTFLQGSPDVTFRIPGCDFHSPAPLDLFISSTCTRIAFAPLGNFDQLLCHFPLSFLHTQKEIHLFIAQLMTILMQFGMVFVII